jgi:CRP/FNR family transcriptional regulator, cyclic AMP receptor protein
MIMGHGVIESVRFLRNAAPEQIRSFSALGGVRAYPRGNILYYAGDPCHALYVVIAGKVKTTLIGEDGREVGITVQQPGGVVGLVSCLDEGPHHSTALTLQQTRLLVVPAASFRQWIIQHPAIQTELLRELAGGLRAAYARIGNQILLPVKERVRAALREIAMREGTRDGAYHLIMQRPTHQEIAERVGSTRVVVTRAIKALLEEESLFHMDGRVLRVRITAIDPS